MADPAPMTRIDFHSGVPDKLHYACRLIRKARSQDKRMVVLAADARQLAALDELLWTFSEQDFLPHVAAGDPLAPQTPVILAARDEDEVPHHEVLINLTDATPAHFARFERMIEVISTDEADVLAGRARYSYYKQRGYPVEHLSIKSS